MATAPAFLDYALRYAALGWPVFPLKTQRKDPATEHGFKNATTDPSVIREWWKRNPKANIGLPATDLFWILDVDPRNGGIESLELLESKHGKLPDTLQAQTGSGGRHYFFQTPTGGLPIVHGFLPGMDAQAPGSYVVAAPSVHPNGSPYIWDGTEEFDRQQILLAPEWLVALVRGSTGGDKGKSGVSTVVPDRWSKGKQHDTLASIAGTMRYRGSDYLEILAVLRVMNETRCEEPGSDENIQRLAKSAVESWEPGVFKQKSALNGHAASAPADPEIDYESCLKAETAKVIESKNVSLAYKAEFISLCVRAGPEAIFDAREALLKAFPKEFKVKGVGAFDGRISKGFAAIPIAPVAASTTGLAQVLISGRQLRDISRDAIKQTAVKNDPPSLFVRSGCLVHVIQDENERPSVSQVTESRLRGVIARTCDFMKYDRFGELKDAFPPVDVVRDILAFNPITWPFPHLTNVVEVPVLRPDGSVLDQPGYDKSSGIYYAPASDLKSFPLPDSPTQEDVLRARGIVEEAIGEFPYVDAASKANLYGLLLTPVLRPAISGCAPLAVVDAPQAGTGKSLLIDVLSIITTGRPAAMMPYPYKEEEMQKQIGASLSAGRQLIVFDNLEGELRSPALALAITAKEFEARILGVSQNMTVSNASTWIVTGNNIRPAGDMPRRCYQIRLNANAAQPYTGRKFTHPRLLKWVTENRSEILHALLVIARYWFSSRSPQLITETVGSFEDWHQTVGSVVTHARISGFLENYSEFIEQEDESPRQWGEFLATVFEKRLMLFSDKDGYFHVSELIDSISRPESVIRDLVPAEIADCFERKVNHRIAIGKMLRTRRERRFSQGGFQYWLERDKEADSGHKGSARWCVLRSE
jgi:hypothetical protein